MTTYRSTGAEPERQDGPPGAGVQLPNGRWKVGDEGRQPEVRPRLAKRFKAPPADVVINGADVRTIAYRAASFRGLNHQELGEPRQDAYAVRFTRDQRWLVGCISDGVSEGALSHEAAEAAVARIAEELVTSLTGAPPGDAVGDDWKAVVKSLPWDQAVDEANAAIVDLARSHLERTYQQKGKLDELGDVPFARARPLMSATALALVVATEPTPDGFHRAAVAEIAGDSAGFVLHNGRWDALTKIKNEGAEIYSGSVASLPSDVKVEPAALEIRAGVPILVMTDGLGDPFGAGMGEVGKFLAEAWQRPPDLLEFAQQLAFYRKSFADDRTALMVWTGVPEPSR
ncbi:protein phosphatase 2C domain-containing protein [Actinoplanes sp. NPDC051633]|uniref:protein phosphatase 2C domain-containing protein n=1 Tax=Actinoplanes sp. NPDC051633 TaxID=3155670 RepID=UPI0034381205